MHSRRDPARGRVRVTQFAYISGLEKFKMWFAFWKQPITFCKIILALIFTLEKNDITYQPTQYNCHIQIFLYRILIYFPSIF